ncbi:MAG: hypothetical protein Q7U04_09045 [Bacteriovorax sp.]|nr:hypothetical protein [Bacteriovorax sp.]
MLSFINFLINILKKKLNLHSPKIFELFFQEALESKVQWVSIAINKKSIAGSVLTKELDLRTENNAYSLKLALTNKGIFHHLWKNQESVKKLTLSSDTLLSSQFNRLIDRLIETEIIYFQKALNIAQEKIYSPTEISQEEKALEWIKVSFRFLEKAVIESLTNPELFFQTLLFFGINPKSQNREFRIICFNLDIQFELLENNNLRIKIYNDKNGEFGSNKKTDLQGDFSFRKREILDELTTLLSVMATGIK